MSETAGCSDEPIVPFDSHRHRWHNDRGRFAATSWTDPFVHALRGVRAGDTVTMCGDMHIQRLLPSRFDTAAPATCPRCVALVSGEHTIPATN